MGAKVDKNKNIIINNQNQNDEVIEYLGYEEFPNEKNKNDKIKENVVNKDNNIDQNEKLRGTPNLPKEKINEELNNNEDNKKEEIMNDKKEENINENKEDNINQKDENKINENIDNIDKDDENKDKIEQEKLNENNVNNIEEIKEIEKKEEEENNNINNKKEEHNDGIEIKVEPKIEENDNNINNKNQEENNQINNINDNINENNNENNIDLNIEQNKINQIQEKNDNQEKLNENINNINDNNNVEDIKKEGDENNNNINNNNEAHPKKISLPNINVIISEKVLEEGAGNELLFMSNLNKIVNISIKERVKYSEKFCITTKDNFLIYETKENYIKVKKPLAIIPISSIQNVVLFKLTKKVNSYDYFYIEIQLNDNIKKNVYNQIDTFYINDLDNNTNENQSDTSLIMFKAEEKNLAKKWYVLLKYLADLKSKK